MVKIKKKLKRKIAKFVKKSTLMGFLILIYTLGLEFYEQEFHDKKFTSDTAYVIDGDTIRMNGQSIRLKGIDAPEHKQICMRESGARYPCGKFATENLIKLIAGKAVKCTDEGKDKYQRQLSYCYADGSNINRKMLSDGYAVTYMSLSIVFNISEYIAKMNKRGIWEGNFENPSDWRKKHKSTGKL